MSVRRRQNLPPGAGGTVMVTGASSGIGRELARCLAPRAATMILVARRTERLQALRGELTSAHPKLAVTVTGTDLCDPEALAQLLAGLGEDGGRVDLLVNNAGVGIAELFDRTPWERTETVLQTNVVALTPRSDWCRMPPEGDAGTGMVATNSVAQRTGQGQRRHQHVRHGRPRTTP